jgi:hypothetical protein
MAAIGVLSANEGFLDAAALPDAERWSRTILAALMTGAVSVVVGRKVGK